LATPRIIPFLPCRMPTRHPPVSITPNLNKKHRIEHVAVSTTKAAAAGYIVQKGTRVLSIMLAGQGLGAPEKHKEALRKAAAGALGRL